MIEETVEKIRKNVAAFKGTTEEKTKALVTAIANEIRHNSKETAQSVQLANVLESQAAVLGAAVAA